MELSIFKITQITQFTQVAPSGTENSDTRLLGYYEVELASNNRQVILRKGASGTDLAMKQGQGGWDLEILLPPLTYSVFTDIIANAPSECSFDRSEKASEFQIHYVLRTPTRTVKSTFCIK